MSLKARSVTCQSKLCLLDSDFNQSSKSTQRTVHDSDGELPNLLRKCPGMHGRRDDSSCFQGS